MFLPTINSTRTIGFDDHANLSLLLLLKWSAGSLTRINETIARLTRKDPTKMRAPISTLRQVSPVKKSDIRSNISMQFATRFQDRLEQFLHYLFRCLFKIEFRFFSDFPKLVQATGAGAFEREHLD